MSFLARTGPRPRVADEESACVLVHVGGRHASERNFPSSSSSYSDRSPARLEASVRSEDRGQRGWHPVARPCGSPVGSWKLWNSRAGGGWAQDTRTRRDTRGHRVPYKRLGRSEVSHLKQGGEASYLALTMKTDEGDWWRLHHTLHSVIAQSHHPSPVCHWIPGLPSSHASPAPLEHERKIRWCREDNDLPPP